jgi:hypothetical protein
MQSEPVVESRAAARFLSGAGRLLIGVFVLPCGWVEDVAARKEPGLLPWAAGGRAATMGG